MVGILRKLLKISNSNWGYSTPLQERFHIGCKCRISQFKTNYNKFKIGEVVSILETGRHDYLVENEKVLHNFEYISYGYKNRRRFFIEDIKYFSPYKEGIEMWMNAKRYNL